MSTNPKPQRKPKETQTAAHRTSSSRVAVRSLAEFTCCRAGAPGWVCARRGRLPSDPSRVEGASLSRKIGAPPASPGESQDILGLCMATRAAAGQVGSCPPAGLVLLGAPPTPGIDHVIWARSSTPLRVVLPTSWGTSPSLAPQSEASPEPWHMVLGSWKTG
uniref:Protein F n=1 Tax=Hepacivirus hominis TaxID=3052230 RepID=U5Y693_9HEPC|nr:protein F [Hepacivirus hominis]